MPIQSGEDNDVPPPEPKPPEPTMLYPLVSTSPDCADTSGTARQAAVGLVTLPGVRHGWLMPLTPCCHLGAVVHRDAPPPPNGQAVSSALLVCLPLGDL